MQIPWSKAQTLYFFIVRKMLLILWSFIEVRQHSNRPLIFAEEFIGIHQCSNWNALVLLRFTEYLEDFLSWMYFFFLCSTLRFFLCLQDFSRLSSMLVIVGVNLKKEVSNII